MDVNLIILLIGGGLLFLFAEVLAGPIFRWTGIVVVWLLSFGHVDLRRGARHGDSFLSMGCGVLFYVAMGVAFKYLPLLFKSTPP